MPSSYGSTVAAAVFILALTFSTYAHAAETAATTIHDPVTDTIQLWSSVLTSTESLANQLAAAFAAPHKVLSTVSPNNQPASNNLTPTAFPAAAAVAASNLNAAPQPIHSGPTSSANAAGASDPSPHYVTQGALNAQLSALEKTIVSELQTITTALTSVVDQSQNGKPSLLSVPSASSEIQQQLDALQNEISQTNRINDLSNVTITSPSFSGVTTSNIPEGSNLYYTDARVTSLLAATAATTTFGGGIALSSGCVSVNGTCLGTGGGGGSGTVTSIIAGTGLTGGTITTSGTIALNTANQNTWSALQLFAAGASSTAESVFNDAFFGATATSSFNSAGQLVLANLASAVLAVDNTGKVIATSSIGTNLLTGTVAVANGGTGSTILSGILKGNGTSQVATAIGGTDYEFPLTFSAPLSRSTNAISIAQANGSTNGYLASTDWTTFNGKVASTSLSGTYPVQYNSGTGAISLAFGTTTNNTFAGTQTFGNLSATDATTSSLYVTGVTSHLLKTDSNGQVVVATVGIDYQAAGMYLTGLGNYATTTGASISFSTSTVTANGQTLGLTAAVSANNILFTPTISGTLNNSGLANSTIGATSPNSTLSLGAAASLGSTFTADLNLAHSNWWTTLQNFTNATTSGFEATSTNVFFSGVKNALLSTDQNGRLTATSSIGTNLLTGTLGVGNGGTGAVTFGQGWIYSTGGAGALAASTSPTVNYIVATSTTATSTFANGIAVSGGCVSVNGTCLGTGGGGGVTSITAGAGLTGGTITTSGTIALDLTALNNWTGLQTFQNASTTMFSAYGPAYFGTTATSTFDTAGDLTLAGNLTVNGPATSTLAGGINATYLNLTGSAATSTAANGINLAAGCFSIAGTCVGNLFQSGIGGAFTVDSGQTVSAGNLVSLLADGDIAPAGSADAGGIDFGTPVIASASTNGLVSGAATDLSSTSYVLTYEDSTNSTKLTTVACSVSGTTVTCGTPVVASVSANGLTNGATTDLSSTSYVLTYQDTTNSNELTTVACSVSGTTVTCGTPVVASASTNGVSGGAATDLSSTSYVLTYEDSTNSTKLTTVACSVSGTTVTCGTPVLASASTNGLAGGAATDLSSTSYVLTYKDTTNSKLTTVACSVSGTTVTCGTPVIASASTNGLGNGAATFISSTSYVLTYKDSTNSTKLTTVACSVSGTTVTCGTPVLASNTASGLLNGAATDLSSTSYVLTYEDSTNSTKLTTVACSVSGTTVTCGTPVLASNTTVGGLVNGAATDLSSTSYVLTYEDSTNSTKLTTVACSVSGTTVTCGTPVLASNTASGLLNGAATDLSSTSYVLTYEDSTNSTKLTTVACSVSGTTVTCGTPVLASASTNGVSGGAATFVSSTSYVLTYKDNADDNELTTIAGNFVSLTASYPVGVAATAGSAGQSVNVVADGIASGFSGLTIGTVYYANTDGTITRTSTPERLGIAISSTQIELSPSASGPNTSTLNFSDAVFANNFRITEAQNGLQALVFLNQLGTQIAELDETGKLSVNNLNLADLQVASGTSLCLDANNDIVTSQGGCSPFATTTVDELLSTSTTISLSTSTPWIGAFSGGSNSLQTDLATLTGEVIRAFEQPIYAAVGIFGDIFAQKVHTDQLCVGSTCVTPVQFQAMVAAAGVSQGNSEKDASASTTPASSGTQATNTPPTIQVNGDNPAILQVGATYNDLGATVIGPQADLNLGITTYVNGIETSPVQIDTGTAATDTIDYIATDQSGLTSTSTRTVIIEASPSIVPTDDASTTTATSTAQ